MTAPSGSGDVVVPGLGLCEWDDEMDWHISAEVMVGSLGDARCRFLLQGYDDDTAPDEIHAAITRFLNGDTTALRDAAPHIFDYYQDMAVLLAGHSSVEIPEISGPSQVLDHVSIGSEVTVSREDGGEGGVYLSVECNCDWEPEHGLQIVFQDGASISKIGPYDGHLTNAHATGDPALAGVVYRRIG